MRKHGLTGSAILAAKAAVRTGSGLVYLGVPESVYPICASRCLGPVVFPLPCDADGRLSLAARPEIERRMEHMDAVLLGPGLGRSEEITALVRWLLGFCHKPLVLDADGINALEGHIDVLRGAACPVIVTPHDGEFLRLGGDPMAPDRVREATDFANRTGCILLLKGHRTIITDGWNIYLSTVGNPGMATGGSGDVLSGVIVSLLGQGRDAAGGGGLRGVAPRLGGRSGRGRDRRVRHGARRPSDEASATLEMSGWSFLYGKKNSFSASGVRALAALRLCAGGLGDAARA